MDRFWAKVRKSDGCWWWTASQNGVGYGQVWIDGRRMLAHRASFYIRHGRLPVGVVKHSCDNKACVNPDHLSEGTQRENMREAVERGLLKRMFKTHCKRGHTRSEFGYKDTRGRNCCRACSREQNRRCAARRGMAH